MATQGGTSPTSNQRQKESAVSGGSKEESPPSRKGAGQVWGREGTENSPWGVGATWRPQPGGNGALIQRQCPGTTGTLPRPSESTSVFLWLQGLVLEAGTHMPGCVCVHVVGRGVTCYRCSALQKSTCGRKSEFVNCADKTA